MVILKCKMCGGDIEVSADKTYGTCDSCGSTMTLALVDDEQRANLFNRANRFRQRGEFDKAIAAYENILNKQDNDAEAHWGVVLSKFGVEYVEDPVTKEMHPTCHRGQIESILTDSDYLLAVEHAPDVFSKELYLKQANEISEVQKGILAISQKEEPFDVFICYKESTETGTRTKDSTLAQDIYYQLTQQGLKVFFAKITLEDKIGREYEPYIFAALNSAKVMVVVGTKVEYFNATWVKNEWSRYLKIIKNDRDKLIIPCYIDMDAYDLPDELSIVQSQDMSKIGFVQDLIRGITKVTTNIKKESVVEKVVTSEQTLVPGVGALIKRGNIFLEDRDWNSADEYFEKVLDLDPENTNAYIGKLLAKLEVPSEADFGIVEKPYYDDYNYKKAIRFGGKEIENRLQILFQQGNYMRALIKIDKAKKMRDIKSYCEVIEVLGFIEEYQNSKILKKECIDEKNLLEYTKAVKLIENAKEEDDVQYLIEARTILIELKNYRDADTLLNSFEEIENEIQLSLQYKYAIMIIEKTKEDKNTKQLSEASEILQKIIGFRDAEILLASIDKLKEEIANESNYELALLFKENGYKYTTTNFKDAERIFISLKGYKDSELFAAECRDMLNKAAVENSQKDMLQEQEEEIKFKRKVFISAVIVACIVVSLILINILN